MCLLIGTMIATPVGEKRIELLKAGDEVYNGLRQPVRVVQALKGTFKSENSAIPILIREGALKDDRPYRDLYISPNHKLQMSCRMKTVHKLVGEVDHVEVPEWQTQLITYYHLELEGYETMIAQGVEVESYKPPKDGGKRLTL